MDAHFRTEYHLVINREEKLGLHVLDIIYLEPQYIIHQHRNKLTLSLSTPEEGINF